MNTIHIDMDGTIYSLYEIENWLSRLSQRDATVFNEEAPRKNLPRIIKALSALKAQGWRIEIVTWAPIGVTEEDPFFNEVAQEKTNWIVSNFPIADDIIIQPYGTPKFEYLTYEQAEGWHILVDDNKAIRKEWRACGENFLTINASRSYVKALEGLIG